MDTEIYLKKVPQNIKKLIAFEAKGHRRSLNQEVIVLLEEALLNRAKAAIKQKDAQAILERYAVLSDRDTRNEAQIIEYDELGLPR
jgi:hypothetical protein